jgi:hypothetical protein
MASFICVVYGVFMFIWLTSWNDFDKDRSKISRLFCVCTWPLHALYGILSLFYSVYTKPSNATVPKFEFDKIPPRLYQWSEDK